MWEMGDPFLSISNMREAAVLLRPTHLQSASSLCASQSADGEVGEGLH